MKMIHLLWILPVVFLLAGLRWFFTPEAKAQAVSYASPIPPLERLDMKRLKSAVRAVENSTRAQIGPAGERSEYQFTFEVWHFYSHAPFELASRAGPEATAEIERVALRHLKWIIAEITRQGYTVTAQDVGAMYKGGWGRWSNHTLRFVDQQYALRFLNVYCDSAPKP